MLTLGKSPVLFGLQLDLAGLLAEHMERLGLSHRQKLAGGTGADS
ncbi:MAG: hypothetical protein ACRDKF_16190 [Actinomycetota bacterium]